MKERTSTKGPPVIPGPGNETSRAITPVSSPGRRLGELHRIVGNQAIQRLFESGVIQAKLKIGEKNDIYEQEADRIADMMLTMPDAEISGQRSAFSKGTESVQMKSVQPFPKGPPCGEEEIRKSPPESTPVVQRKAEGAGTRSDFERGISALRGNGQPLPGSTRAFFEARLGVDLDQVRVHADDRAGYMADAISARALTIGRDIVFGPGQYSPETESGKRLLGHELTHVMQQAGRIMLKKKRADDKEKAGKPPYYEDLQKSVEADEGVQKSGQGGEQRKKLLELVRAIDEPGTADDVIRGLVSEFDSSMEKFHPSFDLWEMTILRDDFDYTDAKYRLVFSSYLADQIAARLALRGFDAEAAKIRKYARRDVLYEWPLGEPVSFYGAVVSAAMEDIDLPDKDAETKTVGELLKAYRTICARISELKYEVIEKDLKSLSILGDHKKGEMGFFSAGGFFEFLEVQIGRIYQGLQVIVQHEMDAAISELERTNQTKKLDKVDTLLEEIKPLISDKVKFADGRDYLIGAVGAEVTKSVFSEKGGRHEDFFGKPGDKDAPGVRIGYYDVNQKTGKEKELSLARIYHTRKLQVEFLRELYGLDSKDKGTREKGELNRQLIKDFMKSGRFRLNSIDDWRKFLRIKLDYLLDERGLSRPEAFLELIQLLQKYLRAFTISTPYNIDDFGDNLLTKTFPRALTGQLILDCGAFALRIIYMLSLVGERLNLKFRYVLLPNHVGLVVTGEGIPALVAHNNALVPFAADKGQLDLLSEETRGAFFREDYVGLDKIREEWDKYTRDSKAPGKSDDEQFFGELAGSYFIPHVDMPFRTIAVSAGDYSSRKSEKKIKKALWKKYKQMSRSDLFGKETRKEGSEVFQINLRYLHLIEEYKIFHNYVLIPFWNVNAHAVWKKYEKDLLSLRTEDKEKYKEKAGKYREEIVSHYAGVEDAYQKLLTEKRELGELMKEHPGASAAKRMILGDRTFILFEYYWMTDLKKHLANIEKGVDIPPFSSESGFLRYIE